jgi:hypothetical protein
MFPELEVGDSIKISPAVTRPALIGTNQNETELDERAELKQAILVFGRGLYLTSTSILEGGARSLLSAAQI